MHDKPQYSVTLLPGNEVRFLSLSRKAKVKPEYRHMGAKHYPARRHPCLRLTTTGIPARSICILR